MDANVSREKPIRIGQVPMTDRVKQRKTEMILKYDSAMGRNKFDYCIERAWLLTESMKKTEGEPINTRRAKALAHILGNMTLFIQDGELIVGNCASTPESVPLYPEMAEQWMWDLMDKSLKPKFDEEGRGIIHEIVKYWEDKRLAAVVHRDMPDGLKEFRSIKRNCTLETAFYVLAQGGVSPNYEKIFNVGLNGITKECEDKLLEIRASKNMDYYGSDEYHQAKDFLEAAIISLKGVINFSHRFAAKAREMAKSETHVNRKKELQEIADICEWVPANPPRTFREACQSFWLVHLVTHHLESAQQGFNVRFDKVTAPFYERDKAEGRITYEDALELIELLWIKTEETSIPRAPDFSKVRNGAGLARNATLGGLTPEGDYFCNDISYAMIDATYTVRTLDPQLALRYHEEIPENLLRAAIDLISTGHGQPSIYSDHVAIPLLLRRGVPLRIARDYVIECVQIVVPGESGQDTHHIWRGRIILPRLLELVLFGGKDKTTGQLVGYATKDPITFTSLEEIKDAFIQQLNFFMQYVSAMLKFLQPIYQKIMPTPFYSCLLNGCIENAKDSTRYVKYCNQELFNSGHTNVVDSLAAMKKLVFDTKEVSIEELQQALRANWEGYEILRQKFLSAPKFGNDDRSVDLIAREMHRRIEHEVEKFTCFFGRPLVQDGSTASSWFAMAPMTGATPDGRKDREFFADAVVSPMRGLDKKGPTAVLKSVSKVDSIDGMSYLLNQRFLPQFLRGELEKKFADYVRAWGNLGIYHIQFNTVDTDTLREAQKQPERHASLVVRVAGYSAFFVDLTKDVQDGIIERTAQCL